MPDTGKSRTAYKIIISLAFGLLGFYANFHPLDVMIPPNKASFVWGLVFPMLISISWGWRYGLLSATLGLGAQTMWFLWLPKNGWSVFVAVPVYNLWIVWHGWCAKRAKGRLASSIYLSDIPFRIFFAIVFVTVFSWAFRFNPSPWAPQMTLTTAPPAFIEFIQFKVIIEGFIILLLADVLRNLRIVKKVLLLEDSAGSRPDFILSASALFGLVFWVASGLAEQIYAPASTTLAESLILKISPVQFVERIVVIIMCLAAGLVISNYFSKYKNSLVEMKRLNEDLTKYLFALENVQDEAYLIAPDGSFEYVNAAACKKLGYTKEELLKLSTPDVDLMYDPAKWAEHFPVLKEKGSLRFESKHKKKDGTAFPVEILANYFKFDGREYNIAFARDITDRVRAAEQIAASLKEKEILLREIHHRVKNNMAVISALLSLQLRYVDDAKYQAMFQESRGRITSMALVHEQLYKSSDFSHISVPEYITTLARGVRNSYDISGKSELKLDVVNVSISIDELIPLGLMVNELLTNAYKYGSKGRHMLTITVSLSRSPNDELTLNIEDNGDGLPEAFEIGECAGLGLRIVETLTLQISGRLSIQPKPARFTITFPEKIEHARHLRYG